VRHKTFKSECLQNIANVFDTKVLDIPKNLRLRCNLLAYEV